MPSASTPPPQHTLHDGGASQGHGAPPPPPFPAGTHQLASRLSSKAQATSLVGLRCPLSAFTTRGAQGPAPVAARSPAFSARSSALLPPLHGVGARVHVCARVCMRMHAEEGMEALHPFGNHPGYQ